MGRALGDKKRWLSEKVKWVKEKVALVVHKDKVKPKGPFFPCCILSPSFF